MFERMPSSETEPLDSLLYLPPQSRLGMATAVDSIRRAVFLDRDGAIVEEINYLTDPSDLTLLPGSVEGIRVLQEQFLIVIVTNQSAVARGWLSREKLLQIHQALDSMLEQHGALLDAILTCPHHPDDRCTCRKPAPGMSGSPAWLKLRPCSHGGPGLLSLQGEMVRTELTQTYYAPYNHILNPWVNKS